MMLVDNKFDIHSIVYLKTDREQLERIVLGFDVDINGVNKYKLACGTDLTWHYAAEIRKTRNIKKVLNIND